MYKLPEGRGLASALVAILDREVHRPLLLVLQHIHGGRKRRSINLLHPAVMERIRREPGLLPHQAEMSDIERAIAHLVKLKAVAVEGWNGNGRTPPLTGNCYRVFLF